MADGGRTWLGGALRSVDWLWAGILLTLLAVTPAQSEIYRWTDEDGRTHFSQDLGQVPPHKRAAALARASEPSGGSSIQRYDPAPARQARQSRQAASPTSASQAARATTYEIPVQRAGTSLRVMVRLNNRVNAQFLVDTGASDVLLPQKVADELGLRPSGRTKMYSTANGRVTHDVVSLDSISLGGATAHGVVASVSPSMNIGLLGLSFFNHFEYTVDPVQGVIRLTPNGLKEAGLIRAGRSKAQWRAEYANIRGRIEYNEDRRARVLPSHSRTHNQLEEEVRDLERQLAVLDSEADRGRVPYSWRR